MLKGNVNILLDKNLDKLKEIRDAKPKEINLRELYRSSENEDSLYEKRFQSINAIVPIMNGQPEKRYYITDNGIPVFQLNEWLNKKNKKKNTGKKYSNILVRFLNYLDMIKKEYWEVDEIIVEDYVLFLLFGNSKNITLAKAKIRYKTIDDNVMVIKTFYKWLSKRIHRVCIHGVTKKMINTYAFLYGQISETDYEDIILKHLDSMLPSREYIKWYTDEQIDAMVNEFKTLRDKGIFLCSVDGGMRIDEVISIMLSEYDSISKTVTPSRSKSKELREVVLSARTCKIIDNYIFTERADAEVQSGNYSEYLFINLRKGDDQGKDVSYPNFYKIFKLYAEKAGFPVEAMRTHSGRSTKTMELLKYQAMNPNDKITDAQIMMIMGWTNSKSIEPYKNHRNSILGKLAQEKMHKNKDRDGEKE